MATCRQSPLSFHNNWQIEWPMNFLPSIRCPSIRSITLVHLFLLYLERYSHVKIPWNDLWWRKFDSKKFSETWKINRLWLLFGFYDGLCCKKIYKDIVALEICSFVLPSATSGQGFSCIYYSLVDFLLKEHSSQTRVYLPIINPGVFFLLFSSSLLLTVGLLFVKLQAMRLPVK